MDRRHLLALLLLPTPSAARAQPAPDAAAERQRQLDEWWRRQQGREAADRAREAPFAGRRALTRDAYERWNWQRDRRRNGWRGTPY